MNNQNALESREPTNKARYLSDAGCDLQDSACEDTSSAEFDSERSEFSLPRSDTFSYGPEDALDLEMLGIDASRTSREAHTALQQLAWFEQNPTLMYLSLAESLGMYGVEDPIPTEGLFWSESGPGPGFSELDPMRDPGGRLNQGFVSWYSANCPYDRGSDLRDLSAEHWARGGFYGFVGPRRGGLSRVELRAEEPPEYAPNPSAKTRSAHAGKRKKRRHSRLLSDYVDIAIERGEWDPKTGTASELWWRLLDELNKRPEFLHEMSRKLALEIDLSDQELNRHTHIVFFDLARGGTTTVKEKTFRSYVAKRKKKWQATN